MTAPFRLSFRHRPTVTLTNRPRWAMGGLPAAGLVLCFTLSLHLAATVASAATIVVDNAACTLGMAIAAANSNAASGGCRAGNDRDNGGDIIEMTGDVFLTTIDHYDAKECPNGLPAITSIIRIKGNRHSIARATDVFEDRPWFRILDSTAGSLTIQDATIRNGFLEGSPEPCDGAGIHGNANLINVTVADNFIYDGDGGGISGTVTLTNSRVIGNIVTSGNGGGINGTSTLFDSTVSGNCTGCAYDHFTSLSTRFSQFSALEFEPVMRNLGGGIAGTVTLVNSVVSGNFGYNFRWGAGGGLAIDGSATIVNSTIANNIGSGDLGAGGGILLFRGTATLVNSTVSGNIAYGTQSGLSGDGAGIFSAGLQGGNGLGPGGPITLIHSTISGNTSIFFDGSGGPPPFNEAKGGGIYAGSLTSVNTIIAGNLASNSTDRDCFSLDAQFLGVNFVGDGCGAAGVQLTGDPQLEELADYGSATPVRLPLATSPVRNQVPFIPGEGCLASTVTADQLGIPRPQPEDGFCDIGATEYTGFPTKPVIDNFNQDDTALSSDWTGNRNRAFYRIVDGRVRVRDGGPIYWSSATFGVDQEAYVTLTKIDTGSREHTLLLKVQGEPATYNEGVIEVRYDPLGRVAKVETLLPGRTDWTTYNVPVTFQDGDQLGGRVYSTGDVQIYRNSVLVATVTLKRRDQDFFNQRGGRIGVWFENATKATFDSFGGGIVSVP